MKTKSKKTKKTKKFYGKKFYGFWKYDLFPYLVGGVIHSPCEENGYPDSCIGYWKWSNTGYFVKPFAILPLKTGKKLQDKIDEIKDKYQREEQDLKNKYIQMIKELDIPNFNL